MPGVNLGHLEGVFFVEMDHLRSTIGTLGLRQQLEETGDTVWQTVSIQDLEDPDKLVVGLALSKEWPVFVGYQPREPHPVNSDNDSGRSKEIPAHVEKRSVQILTQVATNSDVSTALTIQVGKGADSWTTDNLKKYFWVVEKTAFELSGLNSEADPSEIDEIDMALTKAYRLSTDGKRTLRETVVAKNDEAIRRIRNGSIDRNGVPQNLRQYLSPIPEGPKVTKDIWGLLGCVARKLKRRR